MDDQRSHILLQWNIKTNWNGNFFSNTITFNEAAGTCTYDVYSMNSDLSWNTWIILCYSLLSLTCLFIVGRTAIELEYELVSQITVGLICLEVMVCFIGAIVFVMLSI